MPSQTSLDQRNRSLSAFGVSLSAFGVNTGTVACSEASRKAIRTKPLVASKPPELERTRASIISLSWPRRKDQRWPMKCHWKCQAFKKGTATHMYVMYVSREGHPLAQNGMWFKQRQICKEDKHTIEYEAAYCMNQTKQAAKNAEICFD